LHLSLRLRASAMPRRPPPPPLFPYTTLFRSIANDPINSGRGLQLLAKAGLIDLKPGVGYKATEDDIVANPKQLKILQVEAVQLVDRKSTRLNSSHVKISYAVFCLKKKKKTTT